MKILLVITKSNYGGAQRYVYDVATNLPHYTEVVVAMGGDGILADKLTKAGIRTINLNYLQRDLSIGKELVTLLELHKTIKREKPTVLHLNSSKVGLYGAFLGRLNGIPKVIFTAHGWAFNEKRPVGSKVMFWIAHAITILLAHHTIVVSKPMKRSFPMFRAKIKVINPAIEKPVFKSRTDSRQHLERYAPKTDGQEFWFGTIAELHPTKNLEFAIDVLKPLCIQNPNLKYFIIGEGEMRSRLEGKIADEGMEKQLILTGYIDNAATLLTAFDTFVLPSYSEAYGYVLLEAGHCGLPVVASKVGGITDIVEHEKSGLLVKRDNKKEWQKSLNYMLKNPHRARDFGQRLMMKCKQKNSDRMVTETFKLYKA